MTQKELLQVTSKALGLYFAIRAILGLKQFLAIFLSSGFLQDDMGEYYYYTTGLAVFDLLVYGSIAWVLIARAEHIAVKIGSSSEASPVQIGKQELIEVVVVGVSLSVFIHALPQILSIISNYVYFNEYDRIEKDKFWQAYNRKTHLLSAVFECIVALIALLNSRLIALRLHRIGKRKQQLESANENFTENTNDQ
jgi:hypothetical protein